MANLRSLLPDLATLTKQAQLDLHEAIRVSRKVAKIVVKKIAIAKNKTVNKINKTVSSLTPKEAQAILDRLKAEGRI